MDADPQLEERLAQQEAEFSQARHLHKKDFRLRGQVEEASLAANKAQCKTERRTQVLEEQVATEAESFRLRTEGS